MDGVYRPGLRTGDSWSMTTLTGTGTNSALRRLRRSGTVQLGETAQVGDDDVGELDQATIVAAGVGADDGEGLVDAYAPGLSDGALGLLDDDPAVERGLQLLGEQLAPADRAL